MTSLPKPTRQPRTSRAPIARRRTLGAKRREAKAAGFVDPDTWQAVLAFYRYACAYCAVDHWDQQDHCKPLSRGGKHEIGNVVPACARCNYRKGTQTWQPKRRHPWMERLA